MRQYIFLLLYVHSLAVWINKRTGWMEVESLQWWKYHTAGVITGPLLVTQTASLGGGIRGQGEVITQLLCLLRHCTTTNVTPLCCDTDGAAETRQREWKCWYFTSAKVSWVKNAKLLTSTKHRLSRLSPVAQWHVVQRPRQLRLSGTPAGFPGNLQSHPRGGDAATVCCHVASVRNAARGTRPSSNSYRTS